MRHGEDEEHRVFMCKGRAEIYLQQELDENNRLRRALDEAQQKLEAVLELERGNTPLLPSSSALPLPSRPAKRP